MSTRIQKAFDVLCLLLGFVLLGALAWAALYLV
jgi:hypothetical protein